MIYYVTVYGLGYGTSFSSNGGVLLLITGERLMPNVSMTAPTSVTPIQVIIKNGLSTYDCEIHMEKTTSTQIACYTP